MANFWQNIGNGISQGWNWLKSQWEDITGVTANRDNVNATNAANVQIAQETNAQNKEVAQENLGFQRELQEYNKELQQQIFEREDTSYQRTAQDMLAAGLNPLSMQGTNGAGEAIAMAPLNNDYQAQQASAMQSYQKLNQAMEFLNAASTILNGIDQVRNTNLTRDQLNHMRSFDRAKFFMDNVHKGVDIGDDGNIELNEDLFSKYIDDVIEQYENNSKKRKFEERDMTHQEQAGKYPSDSKISTAITDLTDWLLGERGANQWEKIKEKHPIFSLFDFYAKQLMNKMNPDPAYDEVVKYGNGATKYYKNGQEVDVNGNPINK